MDLIEFKNAHLKTTTRKVNSQNRPCFLGAWYYKAYSTLDYYLGIEAVITLPEFIPDESRFMIMDEIFYKDNKENTFKQYLDTPSIYLGGKGNYESDVGFGWFRGVTDSTKTKITDEKITFRPFWRYIFIDLDGNEKNIYEGTPIYATEHYYFPGDKLKVMVISPVKDHLMMVIELIEATKIEKYVKIRSQYLLKDNLPSSLTTPLFPSPGHGVDKVEFKRVNAIDQYKNEGKPAFETNARVLEMTWHEVNLFIKENEQIIKLPFDDNLICQRMLCPTSSAFNISKNEKNEEVVYIDPRKKE